MKINTNNSELKRIGAIQSKTFMKNYILVLDLYLSKYGVIKTFNYLSEILKKFKTPKNSQNYYIQIYMIEYLFLKSKENGIARSNIFITTNTKDKKFIDYTTIIVDGETQKPDMDLIIYSLKK